MVKLKFDGVLVSGEMDLNTTYMVCVPSHKYQEVVITLKSDNDRGINIEVMKIITSGLSYEEKKKLGYEIENRWNSTVVFA